MKVTIAPDFRDLFPPLTADEFEQLKANNFDDPDHDRIPPIVIWQCTKDWIIVEGHHTHKARSTMRVNGKPAKIRYHEMDFPDRESAKSYARRAQLARRNLSASQIAMIIAQEPKVPAGANLRKRENPGKDAVLPPSREKMAKDHKISPRTINHADKVVEQGAKAVRNAVTAGEVSVSDAASVADLPKKEQTAAMKSVKQKKAKTLKAATGTKAKGGGKLPRKLDRNAYYKQWDNAVGPLVRLVSKIGHGVDEHNGAKQKKVKKCLHDATAAMQEWMEVKK